MTDVDILHFESLKKQIQNEYLKTHTPSEENISKWKGIDIIYFQEELRKKAKGNISEKSFYTYFKNSPVEKLPRIDILNILSIYAGYESWYDFKKANPIHLDLTENQLSEVEEMDESPSENISSVPHQELIPTSTPNEAILEVENPILQKTNTENQPITEITTSKSKFKNKRKIAFYKRYFPHILVVILGCILGFISLRNHFLTKEFYYNFVDADRNSRIKAELDVKILKDNESPITYTAKPNEQFVYRTKSKTLIMVVSSPFYKTDTIRRNLETAPESETIELKPNDYAQMLYYYSRSPKDLKKKRETLNNIIADNALIYQVFDSEDYAVETMSKQRYISLVTLPTTSLENLEVITTRTDKTGRIDMIKFKIKQDETENH